MNRSFLLFHLCNRLRVGLAFLALMAITACVGTSGDAILKSKYMIEVQGQYDGAIQTLEKELDRKPDSAATWYWLGIARFKKQEYDRAIKALEQAFELKLYQTYHLSAYDYLGWSWFYTGKPDKAANAFTMVLKIQPAHPSALLGCGIASLRMHRLDMAIDDLSKLLASQPQSVEALRHRGWAYYLKGQLEPAMADFNKAVSLAQDPFPSQDALRGRGWTHYYMGNFEGAMQDFDQALPKIVPENKPGLHDAYRGKTFASLGLRQDKDALRFIGKANEVLKYDSRKDLSLIHFVIGNKAKTWEYRGGEGYLGANIQDYVEGSVTGAKIAEIIPEGPAAKAGLQSGDVVLNLEGKPVLNGNVLAKEVTEAKVGQTLTATILRDGKQMTQPITIASAEPQLRNDPLIAHVLDKRATTKAPVTSSVPQPQALPGAKSPVSPSPTVAVAPSKPMIAINSVTVIPEKVPAGEQFQVKIGLYAEKPAMDQEKLAITLNYAISQQGRIIVRFKEETLQVPNGETTTINKKTYATKTSGEYEVQIELEFAGEKAKQSATFQIM
jgi:tetratricopeptide (TPR) repeat protein